MTAPPERWRSAMAAATLLLSTVLLFAGLGHYALWDDESETAVIGQGVWRTGDTTAFVGHNIVAYRGGIALVGLKERILPPLVYYVVAPFVGMAPGSSGMARFPFALCGLGAVALMQWWLIRARAPWPTCVLLDLAILGNVSFFLYCRQCRYYGLAMLLTVAIGYVYVHAHGRRRMFAVLGMLLACLLATQYLYYAPTVAVLAADYLLWGRKGPKVRWRDWLAVLLPQLVCGLVVIPIWNPLGKSLSREAPPGWGAHVRLLWWFVRDMNACEFGAGILLLAAPVLYFWRRDSRLLRLSLALGIYIAVVAVLSPPSAHTRFADVRYAAPAIVLCIALGTLALAPLAERWTWAGLLVGVVIFATNIANGGPWLSSGLRCTPWQYAHELAFPPPDPYRAASDWINANVAAGRSIWVLPEYAAYPLMFHAPGPIYAWQLTYPPEAQFKGFAPIYFVGQGQPDYIIAFGPRAMAQVCHDDGFGPDNAYRLVAALPVYGVALYRPELMLRSFTPFPCDVLHSEGVYCFERRPDLPAASSQATLRAASP